MTQIIQNPIVHNGIIGAIVAQTLLLCIGSVGAIGASILQIALLYILSIFIPIVIGAVAGLVSTRISSNQSVLPVLLGFIATIFGTMVVIIFSTQSYFNESPTYLKVLFAYLIPILGGIAFEMIVLFSVNVVRYIRS